jgi:hypothetical protein
LEPGPLTDPAGQTYIISPDSIFKTVIDRAASASPSPTRQEELSMHRTLWLGSLFVAALAATTAAGSAQPGSPDLSGVPVLKKALKNPDPIIKRNAAVALGNIGAPLSPANPANKGKPEHPDRPKITAVVPDLIELVGNAKENADVREAAAVALKEIGPCAELESANATDVLIAVVSDKSNSPTLRARTLWPLRFHSKLATLGKFFDALNTILTEEAMTNQTKDLHYDAAYFLCKYKKKDVSDKALDTILAFLKDSTVSIAKIAKGFPGGVFAKGGDGRIIALQALNFVVNEKYGGDPKKVTQRADIMQQLKVLSSDAKIDPHIREYAKNLLDYLKC